VNQLIYCLNGKMSEIIFHSVSAAVRWSEEVATLTTMKTTLGALLSKPGSGDITRQEAIDIAMTISSLTQACLPWKGIAMKAVYAGRDRDRDLLLGEEVATRINSIDAARKKKQYQLIALGVSTIKAARSVELYGKRYPIKRMARGVGISREQFSKSDSWRILRHEAKGIVYSWLDQAEHELWPELKLRGWVA